MTAALNTATGNQVSVVTNFSNLSKMLSYDAIWLDQRWTFGSLTATEVSNIKSFIATGRRVVMIGESNMWVNWNNQILGIVGGSAAIGYYDGNTSPVVVNSITSIM